MRRWLSSAISTSCLPSDPGRSWPTSSALARCPSCSLHWLALRQLILMPNAASRQLNDLPEKRGATITVDGLAHTRKRGCARPLRDASKRMRRSLSNRRVSTPDWPPKTGQSPYFCRSWLPPFCDGLLLSPRQHRNSRDPDALAAGRLDADRRYAPGSLKSRREP